MPEPTPATEHSDSGSVIFDAQSHKGGSNSNNNRISTDSKVNGHNNHQHQRSSVDADAQGMVISSLKSQVQDLYTQVSQLNSKLVQSYDRVSDLEDNLHIASSTIRSSNLKISSLELERTQHLSALNTGLLVEKSHVTAELTRLMEKATEEAAQRGQAESARVEIEKDLDDLSASLFDQANRMVAEERFARAKSEKKVEEAEAALKGAEEAVKLMQVQMQELEAQKEQTERTAQNLRVAMGKGKWVDREGEEGIGDKMQIGRPSLLSSHLPYQEFLLFVAHLRSVHSSSPSVPAMSTLLPSPFLARLLAEDSEPTLRLDLAPSLNWLSRRSVLAAIHNGQLTVEPMSTASLLQDPLSTPSLALTPSSGSTTLSSLQGYNSSTNSVNCALCGTVVLSIPQDTSRGQLTNGSGGALGSLSLSRATGNNSSSWFKSTLLSSSTSSPPSTPSPTQISIVQSGSNPSQIYIFRLTTTSSTSSSNAPAIPATPPPISSSRPGSSALLPSSPGRQFSSSHTRNTSQTPSIRSTSASSTVYPLCTTNWCLSRLRTTCSLWAFIRTGVVEKVWEEEIPTFLPPPSHPATGTNGVSTLLGKPPLPKRSPSRDGLKGLVGSGSVNGSSSPNGEKPPVPPRRRGLWGMASALGEKAASWTGETTKGQDEKRLPATPPPVHPKENGAPTTTNSTTTIKHSVPPLPPSMKNEAHPAPPPLPRRNESRADVNATTPAAAEASSSPRTSSESDVVFAPTPPAAAPSSPSATSAFPAFPILAIEAAKIPLPESRPATPTIGGVAGAPPPRPPPRRDLSTFAVGGAGGEGVPSRTGSPAPGGAPPPPLPRRAAARGARPISTVGAPAPVVPEAEVVEAKDEEKLEKESEKQDEKVEAVVPVDAETAPAAGEHKDVDESEPKKNAEDEIDESPEATESKEEAPAPALVAEEEKAEIPVPAQEADTSKPSGDGDDATRDEPKDAPLAPEATENPSTDIAVSSPAAPESASRSSSPPPPAPAVEAAAEDEDLSGGGVYVGDRTWEERTWKELVRLREEMFWARIGAVRTSSS